MNRKEYIDRHKLLKRIKRLTTWWADASTEYPLGMFDPDDIISSIENAPKEDVVEVIRCKDCINYMNDTAYCQKHDKGYCCLDDDIKPKNHYCGYAELKKEEHNG